MTTPYLWPDTCRLTPDGIAVGGCDLAALADQFGTPLYVLDEATLVNQATAYRDGFRRYPGEVAVYYAGKALLNLAVAQLVARLGLGLDVVSLGELTIAQRAGFDLARVHLHGNGTPPAELAAAVDLGIGRLIIDNADQLAAVRTIVGRAERRQTVLLRVAPDVIAGGHVHIQTGSAESKFGFNDPTAAAAEALGDPGLELLGLHMHIGSQVRDFAALQLAIARLVATAARLRGALGWTAAELCVGGGLAVPTDGSQPPAAVADYCTAVIEGICATCAAENFPLPRLSVEPGRSLAARAGVAVYTVTGRKPLADGSAYVHIDGGMGDNPRPILYGAGYEAALLRDPLGAAEGVWRISGRYCESGDMLIPRIALPTVRVGDRLAVPAAGAYTLSMAGNYNGVGRPAVVLARNGAAHLIQRRETADDLLARDRPLPL